MNDSVAEAPAESRVSPDSPAARAPPRKRTRTGGDEIKPTCTGCKRRGDRCQWRVLGAFRDANIKVLGAEHPSMKEAVNRPSKRQGKFKILTVEPSRRKENKIDSDGYRPGRESETSPSNAVVADVPPVAALSPSPTPGNGVSNPDPVPRAAEERYTSPEQVVEAPTGNSPSNSAQYTNNDLSQSYISSPEFIVDELTALRSLSNPYSGMTPPILDSSVFSDLDNPANDVFLPGSAYEALHTALRNRQLWTARPDIPSRPGSPMSVHESAPDRRSGSRARTGRFELSPDRENILWQNYLNEICLWLDMFDNHRHFASTFPQMAKSAPHLRYSILALSARQIERKQNEKSQSESLSLYQEAIHLLLPELESKSVPAIASCVILCVLEMLSCNPKEWRRHLDGCAYLIQAAGINGFSGKEEQALFWCFARMDVCGGLISEEETIIPIYNWIPPVMEPHEATTLFLASDNDTYANHTVYLCAQTLGVLFRRFTLSAPSLSSYPGSPDDSSESYVARWTHLFEAVEEWYENRPSQMKSIFCVSANTSTEKSVGGEKAFPTVLYANGAAISGNQLYHTCALLLLQRKPKTLSLARRPKSVLHHARQICAISASNAHHGCWTNALQPLWIAGKVMSHYSEHGAIIETLNRIERETGWATAWRVDDLREFWGDDGE
ncbi:transcription factor domain-containing protein [Aspergillus stella-maris]|uniref:transcription factor domain-containing protein n=1 Tax=Aspergillus stella-maris TaxID=1810926 RepID=UPI003CCCF0D2